MVRIPGTGIISLVVVARGLEREKRLEYICDDERRNTSKGHDVF